MPARKNGSEKITYLRLPIEDVEFLPSSFDVVLSSLAFHYVESFGDICEKVRQMLAPGGTFVFSVEHPVFTAQGTEDWYYGGDGASYTGPWTIILPRAGAMQAFWANRSLNTTGRSRPM